MNSDHGKAHPDQKDLENHAMTFAPVQAVTKALAVLAAVNRGGLVTIRELHADTGIPKPTIVRMLQTLIAAGYVKQHENVRGYLVTSAIRHLSSGFHGAPMVIEAARPLADKLTRDIVWPCAICTLDLDSVVINYSTSPESPIAPFHTSLGMRLSLGGRALGRAYLCFCPPNERRILRNAMRTSENPENNQMDDTTFANILATARANGFAERNTSVTPQSSGTIAVPIRLGKRVLATFGVTYFKSALKQRQNREAVIKAVFKTAAQIESRLQS